MMRLFESLQFGICLLCINLIVLGVSTLLGWLPSIIHVVLNSLRKGLIFSYRLYQNILVRLSDFTNPALGMDLTTGILRIFVSILLSLTFTGLIILATSPRNAWWLWGIGVIHSLAVGIGWDDLDDPEGLYLGRRLR